MGLNLGSQDPYVNAVGGVKLDEPALDLAIACVLVSVFETCRLIRPLSVLGKSASPASCGR